MKTDKDLGQEIKAFLISKGVETPMVSDIKDKDEKRENIAFLFGRIMQELNLDLEDDSLKGTPPPIVTGKP